MLTAVATHALPKTRLYVEPERLNTDRAIVAGAGLHHLRNVLRFKPGDELIVFDGAGRECIGVLEMYQGESAVVRILGDTGTSTESSLDMTIAPCLAKGKKTDLIVEKVVELGADRICVIHSERSVGRLDAEQAMDRVERWRRIAKAAAEQSGRTMMPVVERLRTFQELIASKPADALGLLFTVGADPEPPATLRQRYPDTYKVIAVVGPEGGFSREEIDLARKHGWVDVGLGPRVLRSETAAIVAAAVCQHLWGDLGRRPPKRPEPS
ncbi:MAG TPA: 16S rRNA (uracil(1498)-N(3))-methyltransferase [Candidatus Limnocylindrales bacterium]|nr:16S rRNA (uracil(1498)-N(3))-methyltransferase [Candidatus Limnocylindrales bacterium]